MPFVDTLKSPDDLPAVRLHIPSGPFQRLHTWLLIHRYHKSFLRRVQVKTNDVPNCFATAGPSQTACPGGGGVSRVANTFLRNSAV
jgi:hypothetical protein